ncbi:MAG: IS481 family transposase [bacterium]
MSKTIVEERLRWILPIYRREMRLKDIAIVCPYSKRSLERWLTRYKKQGDLGLIPKSTRAKTNPKETPVRIKERVLELRKEKKECALQLKWKLKKEGINIHERTIGKILKTEGLIRKYRTRKIKWKYIRVPLGKGELVEIDVKYVPSLVGERQYYQFTAIDCSSRWRYLKIYENMGNSEAVSFLERLIEKAPFRIRSIKTDNGSCFTNRYTGYNKSTDPLNPKLHAFDILCQKLNMIHYLIDPGKPAQNGKVERSHRTDQEKFYERYEFKDVEDLKYKLRLWNVEYNNTMHCGLEGKTPNEMVELSS